MNIAFLYLINVRRFTWLEVIENLVQLVASGSCAAVMVCWANQNSMIMQNVNLQVASSSKVD